MTIKAGFTRKVGVACISFGIFIFSVALMGTGWMIFSLSPSDGPGLTLIPGLMLFGSYIALTFCNLVGGAVIYFSLEDDNSSFSTIVKTVFFCGVIAQVLPVIYVNFFLGQR